MLLVLGVEPLPNIRDDIFVKSLVKTLRYVTDMGRCQYVVSVRKVAARQRSQLASQRALRVPLENFGLPDATGQKYFAT
jgi:hypothetical protein